MGGKLTEGEKHSRQELEAVFLDVRRDIAFVNCTANDMCVRVAGSLRRGCEAGGDLDIVVVTDDYESRGVVMRALGADPFTKSGTLRCGCSFVRDGVQVDIVFARREEVGAMMMYMTGPRELNLMQRMRAVRKGLLLNQYGLFRRAMEDEEADYVPRGGRYKAQRFVRVAGATETEVYAALGMEYVGPGSREAEEKDG